jgi:hypothetical protein
VLVNEFCLLSFTHQDAKYFCVVTMFLPIFSSKRELKEESFANRKKLLTEKTVFEKKLLDHFFPYRVSLCIKYFYFILLSYFSFFFSFECLILLSCFCVCFSLFFLSYFTFFSIYLFSTRPL